MRNKVFIAALILGIAIIGACTKRSSADEPSSASIGAIDAALMQAQ